MQHDPKRFPLVEVCDPAQKRGLYLTWAAFAPDDLVYVVHAKHIPHGSFDEFDRAIRKEHAILPVMPCLRIMDRRGGIWISNRDQEKTWFDEFRQRGHYYVPSVDSPFEKLHAWLRPQYMSHLDREVPRLRICARVANMSEGPLWALQRFVWDPRETKRWQYEQPGKDWIDCMKYLAGFPGLSYRTLIPRKENAQRSIADSYEQGSDPRRYGDLVDLRDWVREQLEEREPGERYESLYRIG